MCVEHARVGQHDVWCLARINRGTHQQGSWAGRMSSSRWGSRLLSTTRQRQTWSAFPRAIPDSARMLSESSELQVLSRQRKGRLGSGTWKSLWRPETGTADGSIMIGDIRTG
eukprot:3409928-Rhodomonas_salina.6